MKSLVVYTAIFGNKDILKPIARWPGVECICLTDNPNISVRGWRMIHISSPTNASARFEAKRFKALPHKYFPDTEWSLWVDGTHVPRHNPQLLITKYNKQNLVAFRHPERDCVYDEGAKCIELGYPEATISAQLQKYRDEGFPAHYGLITGTVLLRRHNQPLVRNAMDLWWAEICAGSIRDQLSLPYVLWRSNMLWAEIPGHVYWNNLFWYTPHGKKPNKFKDFLESKRDANSLFWRFILRLKDQRWTPSTPSLK